MVTSTKTVTKKGVGPGGKLPGPNGNGSKRRDGFLEPGSRANRYRIGIWVALASILMMFTALSSAYIVRAASSNDWVPLAMPRVLLLSTALILLSSITMRAARRTACFNVSAGARASANRKGTQRGNPTGSGGCSNHILAFYGRSLDLPIS